MNSTKFGTLEYQFGTPGACSLRVLDLTFEVQCTIPNLVLWSTTFGTVGHHTTFGTVGHHTTFKLYLSNFSDLFHISGKNKNGGVPSTNQVLLHSTRPA